MHNATEVQQQARRIEELIRKLESYREPGLVDTARELAQSVMELHAAALERMIEIVSEAGAAGNEILTSFGRDELAGTVLALYGLHPLDLETRVRRAVDDLQARARGHGSVELLAIEAGVVRIRLHETAPGCGSSAGTLKTAVEEAICQAAPDVARLVIEDQASVASGFVPLEKLTAAAGAKVLI
jgi:Fe-S cluster biogenesis protein NfuA